MKILMLTPMLPSDAAPSGGAIFMDGQIRQLASRHEVTLVCFSWDTEDDARASTLRRHGVTVHAARACWKRRPELATAWLTSREPLHALRFRDARLSAVIDARLAETNFDLIHVVDIAMAQYAPGGQIRRVLTETEVRAMRSQRRERKRWREFQQGMWRQFDRIEVFTAEDEAAARAIAPDVADRIRINPFGVDLPPHEPLEEEPQSVVFVGNFMHEPNVDAASWLVREVMPLLRARARNVKLTIVGSYPPESLRRQASEDVLLTGLVPAVEPFLRRAAVVLAPVRRGGGMRVKVLQGMALGKAVVTTSLGARGLGLPSATPPLAVANTPTETAAITAALLASPSERRELGRRARAFVAAHCSWDSYGARLNALYDELIA